MQKKKKRDVVSEDLERLHTFEELEKSVGDSTTISENIKDIEVTFDNDIEKDVGE